MNSFMAIGGGAPQATFANYWGHSNAMMSGGGWILSGIAMFIFWIAVIWLVIAALRWIFWRGHGEHHHMHMHPSSSRTLDILKERYAKGEINKEQYEQMRKDLQV
jgi:putative membrane protein